MDIFFRAPKHTGEFGTITCHCDDSTTKFSYFLRMYANFASSAKLNPSRVGGKLLGLLYVAFGRLHSLCPRYSTGLTNLSNIFARQISLWKNTPVTDTAAPGTIFHRLSSVLWYVIPYLILETSYADRLVVGKRCDVLPFAWHSGYGAKEDRMIECWF